MSNLVKTTLVVSLFLISCAFNLILVSENVKIKKLFGDYIYLNSKVDSNHEVNDSQIIEAREKGKTDGKIEAMLLMNQIKSDLDASQIDSIITIAEKSSIKDLEGNPNFLSLLNQAAFHKGLHSGLDAAKEQIDQEYDNGYHKAIEDFSCPETGTIKPPLNLKKP
jgi:hypothetical protein